MWPRFFLHAYCLLIYHLILCDRDMRVFNRLRHFCATESKRIFIKRYLKPVTMLKKRLYLRCFLASFLSFYETTASETFFASYSSNFWMTASRLNRIFANVIKIINLTILKVYAVKLRISFLMKSRFILSDYCTA